jgi:rare lipoprotein A (peptidoglycan hydrolase)
MRRVILTIPAILGLLFTIGSCVTQGQGQGLTQRGMATQEMEFTDDSLTAAHPAIPIGDKARVTNIATGKEIEVTITDRINPSATRVIDLSPAAAQELEIDPPDQSRPYIYHATVIINHIAKPGRRPISEHRGMATQEMTGGLFAAHPILPTGSMVKVTNPKNGKEITVTITKRINPSDNRIIDLSPAAASALDIGFGGPVIIEVLSTP